MSIAQPPITTPAFPDRSTRLMLFGLLQILLGCLCGLLAVMMVVGYALGTMAGGPQGAAIDARSMIPAVAVYLVFALGSIWLGVGSILARRWAWTLTVVLSWIWLVMGAVGFAAFLLLVGPMMSATMAQQANMPPQARVVIHLIAAAVAACIYILLPAVFVVFYHREAVRATCLRRDPRIRWTDRCPMPVLALSILLALSVVSMPSALVYGPVMPLFGVYVSGPAAMAVILLVVAAMAYCAWGAYRLKMPA